MAKTDTTAKKPAKSADKLAQTATGKDQAELQEDELKQVSGGLIGLLNKQK